MSYRRVDPGGQPLAFCNVAEDRKGLPYGITIDIMRLFVGTGVLDRPRNLYKTNGSSRTPSPTTVK
ncbi:MAG: hypothetical protein IKL16_00525, partial [Clostridia bacterium]|nr:hypothetical protein [Clostridia bacterium]